MDVVSLLEDRPGDEMHEEAKHGILHPRALEVNRARIKLISAEVITMLFIRIVDESRCTGADKGHGCGQSNDVLR